MSRFEFNATAKALSFPVGGIGTGTVSIGSDGCLKDWKITSPCGTTQNGFTHVLVKSVGAKDNVTNVRVLSSGTEFGVYTALPLYDEVSFSCQYPIATFDYIARSMPIAVTQSVFNPFIPLNTGDSSLPAAMFKYKLTNLSPQAQVTTLSFSLSNIFTGDKTVEDFSSSNINGVRHSGKEGCVILATDAEASALNRQYCWLRSENPADAFNCFWTEATTKEVLSERILEMPTQHQDTSTLSVTVTLEPREAAELHFVLAWKTDMTAASCPDAAETAAYVLTNWKRFESTTDAFRRALFTSTMPDVAKEAAVAVLPVLRSSLLKIDDNGALTVRPGVDEKSTNAFNHDFYLLLKLFPDLEKANVLTAFTKSPSLSVTEDTERMLLNIIRLYAYFRYTHDTLTLETCYDEVISIIQRFTQSALSVDAPIVSCKQTCCDGRVTETANPYVSGLFITALRCAINMASQKNDTARRSEWISLFDNAKSAFHARFFNGEYFAREKGRIADVDELYNDQIFVTDGLSTGSHLSQFYGIYHAVVNELDDVFDTGSVKQALRYVYKTHLVKNMHNVWAPAHSDASYNEGGLLTCSNEGRSALNTRDQGVCRGYESMVSLLMLLYYLNDQGIDVLLLSGERNTCQTKNIFAVDPCAYAPTATAFDFAEFYSGFIFEAADARAIFAPPFSFEDEARGLWITATGWGSFLATKNSITVDVFGGYFDVKELQLPMIKRLKRPSATCGYTVSGDTVIFDNFVTVRSGSRLRMQM